uniref:Uncharacterized protein n=1 Tax=Trichobilharzia regenti TaxID=157069 RepID=A0AA85JD50_TRIRE|nr:unnamed protein product [Trichobilharzia regenti]CAH8876329.1 unnamed protein product [Trichobilharzia regenti]
MTFLRCYVDVPANTIFSIFCLLVPSSLLLYFNLQSSTICCYDLFGLQERSKSPVTDPQIVTLIFTGLQLFSGIPIEFHFLQLTESPPYPF